VHAVAGEGEAAGAPVPYMSLPMVTFENASVLLAPKNSLLRTIQPRPPPR